MLKLLRRIPRWGCLLLIVFVLVVVAAGTYFAFRFFGGGSGSNDVIGRWFTDPASRPALTTTMNHTACPDAPFALPSDGLIGLLWEDPAAPYTVLNPHSGVDIFGDGAPGTVPVYAAADGYLSRLDDWLSSIIIRHDDPLQPGRTIWTYYTHMAARDGSRSFIVDDFPAGTFDLPVKQGTLLGYQGEYAGVGAAPIGLHLHFSIVQSDAEGKFLNEARIANTLDPSPYFGMTLKLADQPTRPIHCEIAE
jgi:peptidoglycan LD-endopeptidase LytH